MYAVLALLKFKYSVRFHAFHALLSKHLLSTANLADVKILVTLGGCKNSSHTF